MIVTKKNKGEIESAIKLIIGDQEMALSADELELLSNFLRCSIEERTRLQTSQER